MASKTKELFNLIKCFYRENRNSQFFMRRLPFFLRATTYSTNSAFESKPAQSPNVTIEEPNPLKVYFDANNTGPGIWKWEHYFDIYHKHFNKYIGKPVNILEIGIYSGGSLRMWKSYFGPNCHIYGVDIEPACKIYEEEGISIFIGDQEDPLFWERFRKEAPMIDIVIDDGGHTTEQQIVTLQEVLPHLNPGGVYLCEDIHGNNNQFNSYISGLATQLSAAEISDQDSKGHVSSVNPFQMTIDSIHFYPFVAVIEKRNEPIQQLIAPKHGTEWQPFSM